MTVTTPWARDRMAHDHVSRLASLVPPRWWSTTFVERDRVVIRVGDDSGIKAEATRRTFDEALAEIERSLAA